MARSSPHGDGGLKVTVLYAMAGSRARFPSDLSMMVDGLFSSRGAWNSPQVFRNFFPEREIRPGGDSGRFSPTVADWA